MNNFTLPPPKTFFIKFFIVAVLFCSGANTKAQYLALDSINLQLRQLFGGLTKPTPARHFLYDMAAHQSDSAFFTSFSSDTNNTDSWFQIYDEMYHSAYDTTTLITADSIFNKILNDNGSDTIPIGITAYDFYTLKAQLTLKQSGNVTIELYSITGQRLHAQTLSIPRAGIETNTTIQLPNLSPGIYLLRAVNGKEQISTKLLIQ